MRPPICILSILLLTTLMAPGQAQTPTRTPTSTTPITDQFKIPPFRDYTGDGIQNLDDIPAHQKNYNDLLKRWAARISGLI